ncbi:MAG TPA: hypothetical protein VFX61_20880 [Micromonosporaceae bacterium]|nr:hypothetical protein [Micromonosporaceae bacterium]
MLTVAATTPKAAVPPLEALALTTLAVSRHPVPGALALAAFSAGSAIWNSGGPGALVTVLSWRSLPPEA